MRRVRSVMWFSVCALLIAGQAAPAAATVVPANDDRVTAQAWVATDIPGICVGKLGDPLGFNGFCGATGNQQIFSTPGSGPVVANTTFSGSTNPPGAYSGVAHATATDGTLGASARDTIACPATGCGFNAASGIATFTDTFLINPGPNLIVLCPVPHCPPPKQGDPGGIILGFDISGSFTAGTLLHGASLAVGEDLGCPGKLGFCGKVDNYYGPGRPLWYIFHGFVGPGPLSLPFEQINFTFGGPFDVTVGFAASTLEEFGNGNASNDFADTLRLSQIQVFDGSGNLVTGWTIVSASGTPYGPDGVGGGAVPTPEPSTWLLLGSGLVGLAFATRKFIT